MTIGLILCLIVALTVAGVIWNYQFMTIQSVEMECAARSAIQAAINDLDPDTSIEKVLQTAEESEVTGTTLNRALNAAYAHQKAGDPPTVIMADSTNKILKFQQKHKLGIFSGTLKEETRTAIEKQLEEEAQERMKHFQAPNDDAEEAAWKNAAKEAALEQLLADDSIALTTREVFRHVALMHEPPMDVAHQFGITRNNVDQIKARLITRLKDLITSMTAATA